MTSSKKVLASLRKQRGFKSQQSLGVAVAKELKRNWSSTVAQKQVSNWETGNSLPTDVERKAIANVLGVSEDQLELTTAQSQMHRKFTTLFEELAEYKEPAFLGICFTSRPMGSHNPSILQSLIKGVRHKLSFAMFVPRGNMSIIRPTTKSSELDYDILNGYINGVWKDVEGYFRTVHQGVSEELPPGDDGLDNRLKLYEPIKGAAFPFPPSGSRYCLTIQSKPDLTFNRRLWIWVHTADENQLELVEDDTTQDGNGIQRNIWESYFSDVVTHWRNAHTLPVDGGLWKACGTT
jgi:transcriptional regulator with XRE-family HTH domain